MTLPEAPRRQATHTTPSRGSQGCAHRQGSALIYSPSPFPWKPCSCSENPHKSQQSQMKGTPSRV